MKGLAALGVATLIALGCVGAGTPAIPTAPGPDIVAPAAVDEAVEAHFAGYHPRSSAEIGWVVVCDEAGPRLGAPIYGETGHVQFRWKRGTPVCGVVHTHTHTRGVGSRRGDRDNEVPSQEDRAALTVAGVPNYVYTPSRRLVVLERVSGRFVVRDVATALVAEHRP